MREIKFRVWDTETSNMLYPWTAIDRGHHSFGVSPDGLLYYNLQSGWGSREIMQYTGLKDKNGKEIYEGDIIKRTFIISKGNKYHDDRDDDMVESNNWGVKYLLNQETLTSQFYLSSINGKEFVFYEKVINEIIGNIHENPELL